MHCKIVRDDGADFSSSLQFRSLSFFSDGVRAVFADARGYTVCISGEAADVVHWASLHCTRYQVRRLLASMFMVQGGCNG